jgi:hypothetical protein
MEAGNDCDAFWYPRWARGQGALEEATVDVSLTSASRAHDVNFWLFAAGFVWQSNVDPLSVRQSYHSDSPATFRRTCTLANTHERTFTSVSYTFGVWLSV